MHIVTAKIVFVKFFSGKHKLVGGGSCPQGTRAMPSPQFVLPAKNQPDKNKSSEAYRVFPKVWKSRM